MILLALAVAAQAWSQSVSSNPVSMGFKDARLDDVELSVREMQSGAPTLTASPTFLSTVTISTLSISGRISGPVIFAGTATFNGNVVFNSSPTFSGSATFTSTLTTSLNWRASCPSGFFEVFRTSGTTDSFGRALGCMQTSERSSDSHLNAMNDCFTAFGAKLPTLNEFAVACSNFASTMIDEGDDNEWLDGGGAAQVGLIVQGATSCVAAGESGQGNTVAYRCFLLR